MTGGATDLNFRARQLRVPQLRRWPSVPALNSTTS